MCEFRLGATTANPLPSALFGFCMYVYKHFLRVNKKHIYKYKNTKSQINREEKWERIEDSRSQIYAAYIPVENVMHITKSLNCKYAHENR